MIKVTTNSNIAPIIKQSAQKLLHKTVDSIPKEVTNRDILMFRQYVFSKDFELRTTKEEIKQLFELEGEEFFNASFEFLFKKLGVPECLKPKILEIPMDKSVSMAYDFAQNLFLKNSNFSAKTKLDTYSYIRHELQHMIQNFEILRHKDLRPQALFHYASRLATAQITLVDDNVRNISLEELEKQGFTSDILYIYKSLKDKLNISEEEYSKELQKIKFDLINVNMEKNKNMLNTVVEKMGHLKEGSRAERRAEKFYNNMLYSDIDVVSGDIHCGKYNFDIRENEAFIAQDVAMREAKRHLTGENDCYLKYVRLQTQEALEKVGKDEKITKELNETALELKNKNILNSPKEWADYLFD